MTYTMNKSISKIYNLGGPSFYEYPIFVYLDHLVYCLFLDEDSLSIQDYSVTAFEKMLSNGIFKPSENDSDFYYIDRDCIAVESKISNTYVTPTTINGVEKTQRIKFVFENKRSLYIEYSDLVPGTMASWME